MRTQPGHSSSSSDVSSPVSSHFSRLYEEPPYAPRAVYGLPTPARRPELRRMGLLQPTARSHQDRRGLDPESTLVGPVRGLSLTPRPPRSRDQSPSSSTTSSNQGGAPLPRMRRSSTRQQSAERRTRGRDPSPRASQSSRGGKSTRSPSYSHSRSRSSSQERRSSRGYNPSLQTQTSQRPRPQVHQPSGQGGETRREWRRTSPGAEIAESRVGSGSRQRPTPSSSMYRLFAKRGRCQK